MFFFFFFNVLICFFEKIKNSVSKLLSQPLPYNNNHAERNQETNTGVATGLYVYIINEELTRPGD